MRAEHHISLARARRKKRGKRALHIASVLLGASVFLVVGFAFLLRADFLQITSVSVSGNQFLDTATIESLAHEELASAYASVFPKANVFLYPRGAVRERILALSQRVAFAEVRTEGFSSIIVSVREHDPAFLWCGEVPPVGARPLETPCFFMNQEGFLFAEAPQLSPGIYFEVYGAPETKVPTSALADEVSVVGTYIFSSQEHLRNILAMRDALVRLRFEVTGVHLAENNRYEMLVHAKETHRGELARIIWDPSGDLTNIVANLESSLETKRKESATGDISAGLLYIDTRFENKVVFKFNR